MRRRAKFTKFLAFLLNVSVAGLGFAMGSPAVQEDDTASSLRHLAARGGVEPETFENFFLALKKAPRTTRPSAECVDDFEREDSDAFLRCLALSGDETLTPELGRRLFEIRIRLLRETPDAKNLGRLALVTYLEDLVRAGLRHDGEAAAWITREAGYLRGSEKNAFDFRDGDVVLGLGNTSLSSLISQVTDTPSRYSHAFIVRKRQGKITTLESLVQTGVREFPLSYLLKDPYNQLTVLRWKNAADRARVTVRASDWAFEVARRKAPYDMRMDFSEDHAIYCSELIVKAYAHAAGFEPAALVPHRSRITDERVFAFAKLLGVSNKVFFSPGDLLGSRYFEVVADYRKPDDLQKSWELYLMGDLFVERLRAGYKVKPDFVYVGVPIAAWLTQLVPSIFHEDARLLPKSIGPGALSVMATTEKKIYAPAFQELRRNLDGRDLLDHALWEIRGEIERALDHRPVVRQSFSR
jgi:hypothetical protein